MKIVILAASSVPFERTSWDQTLWNLYDTLNQKTSHQAELIKLPVSFDGEQSIQKGYQAFCDLALDQFDMVVAASELALGIAHKKLKVILQRTEDGAKTALLERALSRQELEIIVKRKEQAILVPSALSEETKILSLLDNLLEKQPESVPEVVTVQEESRDCVAEAFPWKLRNNKRKKVTVAVNFRVYPAFGGGQERVYQVYRNIARKYDVEIISLGNPDESFLVQEIEEGIREIVIPCSKEQYEQERRLERLVRVPIRDTAAIMLTEHTRDYGRVLEASMKDSQFVVASHPYMYCEIKRYLKKQCFIYEAHNVEYAMKQEMYPENETARKLIEDTFFAERGCAADSHFIMTCSEEDQDTLAKLYGVTKDKMIVVPNGVDTTRTSFVSCKERIELKRSLDLQREKVGIFMGSWHGPNLEACEEIFRIAYKTPSVYYMLIGSQCLYFEQTKRRIPSNVALLGMVSEEEKQKLFARCDFALNPMESGSGTNLKMFDYMSAGLPVITTQFGTRGIERKEGMLIASIREIPAVIEHFRLYEQEERVVEARKYMEEVFDWSVIVTTLLERMEKCQ